MISAVSGEARLRKVPAKTSLRAVTRSRKLISVPQDIEAGFPAGYAQSVNDMPNPGPLETLSTPSERTYPLVSTPLVHPGTPSTVMTLPNPRATCAAYIVLTGQPHVWGDARTLSCLRSGMIRRHAVRP